MDMYTEGTLSQASQLPHLNCISPEQAWSPMKLQIPAPRLVTDILGHLLDLQIIVQPPFPQLTADTAVLHGMFAAHLVGAPLFFAYRKAKYHRNSNEGGLCGNWLACDGHRYLHNSLLGLCTYPLLR